MARRVSSGLGRERERERVDVMSFFTRSVVKLSPVTDVVLVWIDCCHRPHNSRALVPATSGTNAAGFIMFVLLLVPTEIRPKRHKVTFRSARLT